MSVFCIISEFNPLHNGHKYLIEQAKNDGCAVVAVMSGNYTQRGELAFADKYTRAEIAVKCGADLVLELPFPFAMSSAEFFAKGAVSVLEKIGAQGIYFGSESGDVELIKRAALVASSPEFLAERERQGHGEGSAKAYFDLLTEMLGEKTELLSNDILGIEYVKEINRRGLNIEPCAVRRVGDSYRAEEISSDFASATAIRNKIFAGELGEALNYTPKEARGALLHAVENREAPVDIRKIESAVLAFWRLATPASLSHIAELGNGLEYRIREAALASTSLDELEGAVATKQYTDAKIRRAVLFGILGVTKANLDEEPEYTSVLAANSIGREILSSVRKKEGGVAVVTKCADTPEGWQKELSDRADSLYTLAMPSARPSGNLAKKKIYIE